MKVKYLDLETGRTAEQCNINEFELTENNYACDCNRQLAFGDDVDAYEKCKCKRYIVIDVAFDLWDEPLIKEDVIANANSEYYSKIEQFDDERDRTQVDAGWLDEVPGLNRIATLDGWWESENKQVVVELFKETGKSLIRFRKEFHGKIYEGGIGFVEPTRGDVLTALRLFGGKR